MKVKEYKDGTVKAVKVPNAYKGVKNYINGYRDATELHELDGFFDLIIPDLQANESLGELLKVDNYYIYNIVTETQAQIDAKLELKKIQLREEYSRLISGIHGMQEAVERNIIDGTPMPQEILDEREMLKADYDTKLLELGS